MISTAKDLHVALMTKLQLVNTNRKRVFRPEELDYLFNAAMFNFIEERSVIGLDDKGLTENVKRYDDLRDLKVTRKEVAVVREDNTSDYAITQPIFVTFPVDYYKFESLELAINVDCEREESDVNVKDASLHVNKLSFPTLTLGSDYSDFEILDGTTSIYISADHGLDTIYNKDSKFMIVNSVLEVLNENSNYTFYWEQYLDIYEKNCFLIISKGSGESYSLIEDSTTYKSTVILNTYKEFDYTKNEKPDVTHLVHTELVPSKDFDNMQNNYYMSRKRYKKPMIEMTRNTLRIQYNPRILPLRGFITYVKRPRLVCLKDEIMTDFTSHINEIVDYAVMNIDLILTGSADASISKATKNNL